MSRWSVLFVERAYAKINLTLDVLGKRNDGYHDVDMVMQTVDLSDLIWLEEAPGTDIVIDANVLQIPLDDRNHAVAAAKAFQRYSGLRRGLRMRLEKHIPVAAGLGGGSADAAAVLRGLNRLWNTGYALEELAEIGASIGSDVPFCVFGGTGLARGRGEVLTPIQHRTRYWTVLIRPAVFVSTADIYGALMPVAYSTAPHSAAMTAALQTGDFDDVRSSVFNGLTETTMRLYPEVESMWSRVQTVAKAPVFMSGSGPTLYCLTPSAAAGQRVYNAWRGFCKEVYLCQWITPEWPDQRG